MLRRGGLLRRPRAPRTLLARRLPSLLLFLLPLLALAAYLRDWVFEGIVRVGANGRLKELRFAPVDARLSSCPVRPLLPLLSVSLHSHTPRTAAPGRG